jgi:hypothetical protein
VVCKAQADGVTAVGGALWGWAGGLLVLIVVSCWVHQEFRARLCHDDVFYLGCMLVVQL